MVESAIFATATTFGFGVVASASDIAARRIPNRLTGGALLVALLVRIAVTLLERHGLLAFLYGLAWPLGVFVALYIGWGLGLIGAGDVKLAAAFSLALPPEPRQQLIFILGALAIGGIIALTYLLVGTFNRRTIRPSGRNASRLRRILRVERWRVRHRVGIPYAVAISIAAFSAAMTGLG